MATSVEKLILAIETQKFDQAERELNRIRKAAEGAGSAVDNAGRAAGRAGTAFGKMRGPTSALTTTTGQLSVQLQDIAVQAQMGTDYLRIFAQQGPQIASIFGPAGAVFGAVIAFSSLLAGPLIASIMGVEEKTKDLSNELKDLYERFNELNPALQTYIRQDLQKKLLEQEKAARIARSNLARLSTEISRQSTVTEKQIELLQQYQAEEQLAILRAEQYRKQIAELGKTQTEAEKAANRALEQLTEENIRLVEGEAALLRYQLRLKGVDEDTIDFIVALKKQNDAIALTAELEADATKALERERERRAKAKQKESDELLKLREQEDLLMWQLQQQIDKRNAKAVEDYEALVLRIRAAGVRKTIALKIQEANEKARIERENAQRLAEFERERLQEQRDVNEAFLALEDRLMKGKSEKQKAGFRTLVNIMNEEKRARAIEIISNSYNAAMKAWGALAGIPFIGPALGAAAAGTIIAAGASYAAQSLAGRALGGQVRAGESYVVGERGPEVLTMGTNGRVIPNDKIGSTQVSPVNNNVSVSFTIQANDTTGFDQLLQSRRGQIIGIINQALNDQGRRAIA